MKVHDWLPRAGGPSTGFRQATLIHTLSHRDLDEFYVTKPLNSTYVPFEADRIAEPPMATPPIQLLHVLPADVADHYRLLKPLLRPPDEIKEVREELKGRYRTVLGDDKEWVKYLGRVDIRALWRLRPAAEAEATCSIAAVRKSDGHSLRKLVQCCPFNSALLSPDAVAGGHVSLGLWGGEALNQATTEGDDSYAVALDEGNAFTYIETPCEWWPWLAAPAIRVRDLPPSWLRDEGLSYLAPGAWIRPQYRRLPMGHTHAAHLLMFINLNITRQALTVWVTSSPVPVVMKYLNECENRTVRTTLDQGEMAVYIHLDDFIFLASTLPMAQLAANVVRSALERVGFVVKYRELGPDDKYIGLVHTTHPSRWMPAPDKLGNLDRGLEMIVDMEYPPVPVVSCVTSIYVWICLLRREAMSSLHAIFKWIEVARTRRVPLWPSARDDLLTMRGMLPLIFADGGRRPSPLVFAQDAAVDGPRHRAPATDDLPPSRRGAFCLAVAEPPIDEIRAVLGAMSVTGRAGVVPLALGGHHLPLGKLPDQPLHGRTNFPSSWFDGTLSWERVLARRYAWPLEIAEGECRAALAWARVLTRLLFFCAS